MANEKRLIDANEFKRLICKCCNILRSEEPCEPSECNVMALIDEQPTVDAVEVVHGYWEKEHDDLGIDRGWKCSHCKGSVYEMTYEPYQYCPHCGAKMDGDGNE